MPCNCKSFFVSMSVFFYSFIRKKVIEKIDGGELLPLLTPAGVIGDIYRKSSIFIKKCQNGEGVVKAFVLVCSQVPWCSHYLY